MGSKPQLPSQLNAGRPSCCKSLTSQGLLASHTQKEACFPFAIGHMGEFSLQQASPAQLG